MDATQLSEYRTSPVFRHFGHSMYIIWMHFNSLLTVGTSNTSSQLNQSTPSTNILSVQPVLPNASKQAVLPNTSKQAVLPNTSKQAVLPNAISLNPATVAPPKPQFSFQLKPLHKTGQTNTEVANIFVTCEKVCKKSKKSKKVPKNCTTVNNLRC